ncbi:Hypothetical predicted protein [Octopus vulgaris]|uniref:Uncharacterized protein n=1 Tax=Octopus vulgaris TaxID=6645 RepID=A0AA36AYL3_OCTVU|nr:Hypothetical predicted protein [Octopus vulgaris]
MQLQNKRRLRAESSLQRQSQIAGCSAEVGAVAIDEGCLNKTDSNNDFNALAHAFESSTDVLLSDIGNTPSCSRACSVVSEQEHKQRLAKAKATARAAESEVARSLRQKKDAVAKLADRASESEMQRQLRLNRNAETTANARASETADERLNRLGELREINLYHNYVILPTITYLPGTGMPLPTVIRRIQLIPTRRVSHHNCSTTLHWLHIHG